MKIKYTLLFCCFCQMATIAQEIINIPFATQNDMTWSGDEKTYFSPTWQTQVVTNVSIPTMKVFRPEKPNGTSVVIAPGGGLYALSINSEGNDVAKWLSSKGITAFVLKYRLVPTGADGVAELTKDGATNPIRIKERVDPVLPLAIADALAAISFVRENATNYQLDPTKIGFMGFSAGGAVTMGTAYNYNEKNKPNFIVPVYPWTSMYPVQKAPANPPKLLVVCASNDPLGLASGSVALYNSWLTDQQFPALHMYAKGGHGFGMKTQNLPSDTWIARFYEWAIAEKLVSKD